MKDTVGTQDGKIKMEGKLMEKKKTVIYLVYTKGQTLPIPWNFHNHPIKLLH